MKRIFLIILMAGITLSATGQRRVVAKRSDLKDFTQSTTMVVLNGDNSMMDVVLRSAVEKEWKISPYEFCSYKEFENLKADTSLYFLMRINGQFKKSSEPAMEFLSLVKGGPDAENGLDNMADIITIPLQAIDDDGAMIPLVPSLIRIVQAHVFKVIRNNLNAYIGMSTYTTMIDEADGRDILFLEGSVSSQVDLNSLKDLFKGRAEIIDEDELYAVMKDGDADKLIAFTVAPNINQKGGICYKMIIRTKTGELYFYRTHKISTRQPAGFLSEDIKRIALPYTYL